MGRPEKPVPHPARALGQLALGLRSAWRKANLTYEQLVGKTPGVSRATLQRAALGHIPTLLSKRIVAAYAEGCGVDSAPLLAKWEAAHAARLKAKDQARSLPPAVRQIRDEADMGTALLKLHQDAGAPPYREIDKRTQRHPRAIRVPRTTVHPILSHRRFPSSREQLRALLFVPGVPAAAHGNWLRAWSRVQQREQANRRAARTRRSKFQRRISCRPGSPGTAPVSAGEEDDGDRAAPAAAAQPRRVAAGGAPCGLAPPASHESSLLTGLSGSYFLTAGFFGGAAPIPSPRPPDSDSFPLPAAAGAVHPQPQPVVARMLGPVWGEAGAPVGEGDDGLVDDREVFGVVDDTAAMQLFHSPSR
ncbi:hypothetical protein ACIO7M_33530 [Streptomyces toxytricini]|uniref:HTH cro/C1-type domain-containing protein n=1 Tax=Streptomyces toxytricini TaxID=67369 RepID=A0ABW8EVQ8_STRT5